MVLNPDEIEKMITRITQEVLKSMQSGPAQNKTLAVVPGFVFDQAGVAVYLLERHADAALFEGACLPDAIRQMRMDTFDSRQKMVAALADYEEFVMVTPQLSLVHALALGDDEGFAAQLILRPLLWGRKVTLLLDFEAPDYRRGTMFAQLAEALSSLEKAGMQIRSLAQKASPDEPKDFVSEQDIKDAAKQEKKSVRTLKGAIVTQLARDTAKELGISID